MFPIGGAHKKLFLFLRRIRDKSRQNEEKQAKRYSVSGGGQMQTVEQNTAFWAKRRE